MTLYDVTVTLKPTCPPDAHDPEDANDPFLMEGGMRRYLAAAASEEIACHMAGDMFHDSIAIANLENFDISEEARAMSNHEIITLGETTQMAKRGAVEID